MECSATTSSGIVAKISSFLLPSSSTSKCLCSLFLSTDEQDTTGHLATKTSLLSTEDASTYWCAISMVASGSWTTRPTHVGTIASGSSSSTSSAGATVGHSR